MNSISVVLPTFNEVRHGLLPRILANLTPQPWLEVLVVDGASEDGTRELIRQHPHVRLLETTRGNRAQRMNHGIREAKGEIVFLHHPRSLPDPEVFTWLQKNVNQITWGGLTHAFDLAHPLLRFTSWYSNHVRGRLGGIYYLDHCLYFHRRLWFTGALPEVDIFEDTLLCRELRRQAWPRRLEYTSQTSAARFRRQGVLRQSVVNQVAKLAFLAGLPPRLINRFYEAGLNFNDSGHGQNHNAPALRSRGENE
jgi:glycosyltransferase involved in cell wall biosynthesis